jgi:antitoxin CcdA
MPETTAHGTSKRRSVNLTIRSDVMETVRALHLNASKAAEAGMLQAIREVQEKQWLADNQAAFAAHNERVDTKGVLLTPDWQSEA